MTAAASTRTAKLLDGATGKWEIVIGMEVHAQVTSNAKLFSGASTEFGAPPNENVSLVDAAMPGMLPVINRICVEQAVKTGLGLNAHINLRSVFDRKNYFYPDLPAGYQISQYKSPIVGEGIVLVDMPDGSVVEVGIERLHLEQDAGKSIHDMHPQLSFVDLNRAGIALMEIVSKPHLRSADEAAAYLRKLRTILRYLGTCDGNMEQGSMRADVNVSVNREGGYQRFRETGDFKHLGTRCEIKNVNSIRFVAAAVEYEARRQIDLIEDGDKVVQETRLFDMRTGETRSMRSKEEAHDYRYFPDPDLLPLDLDSKDVIRIKESLPELPDAKKSRFMTKFGLSSYDAGVLIQEKMSADFFERVAQNRDPKLAANWVTQEFFGALNRAGKSIEDSPVSADNLGTLIDLIADQTISGKIAKDVFAIMFETGGDPRKIVDEKGLRQVTDTSEIERVVDDVLAKNPDMVATYRTKPKVIGSLVGQVMKATGGKANPTAVNEILKRKLDG